MSVHLQTKSLWIRMPLLLLKLQIWRLFWERSFLTFRQTIECRFTLNLVRDIVKTYSQMHHTDKYSQCISIIWPVWLYGWVYVYEKGGWGIEPRCCQFPNELKVPFIQMENIFPQFIDKFLKIEEVKYLFHYVKFRRWPALFYVNSLCFSNKFSLPTGYW